MACSNTDLDCLLERAADGDADAVGRLLEVYRPRLRRMVALRLDPRVRCRVDESDVVQEACLEATQRIADFFRDRSVPFFIWLRFLTTQRLLALHRRHLGVQLRDVTREVPLWAQQFAPASSEFLATHLATSLPSPSEILQQRELRSRLSDALERMETADREVLAMRHFERMSNVEVAEALGMNPSTASSRYVRALRRLRTQLGDLSTWFPVSKQPDAGR